jgi:hypothetical protein
MMASNGLQQALMQARTLVAALEREVLLADLAEAKATGRDATFLLQALIDRGGEVAVPAGQYVVDAHPARCLQLRSGVTLLADGVTLLVLANALDAYAAVNIEGVSDVTVVGLAVVGEREQHTGTTGEHGHGFRIMRAARVRLDDVAALACWGDGLSIGDSSAEIKITGSVFSGNRRNNISIGRGSDVLVENCIVEKAEGTTPEAGIDIEPDAPGQTRRVVLRGNTVRNNKGYGIEAWRRTTDGADITSLLLESNTVTGNSCGIVLYGGKNTLPGCKDAVLRGNVVTDNRATGVLVRTGCDGVLLQDNVLARNYGKAARVEPIVRSGWDKSVEADVLVQTGALNVLAPSNRFE